MSVPELVFIAIGLSMDAFAVSVCKGLAMTKVNGRHTLIIALFFGGFQAAMPFIGWFAGLRFERYITGLDHWIAFFLLALIGGRMIREALARDEEIVQGSYTLDLKELLILAIATSIDALAVGITFALLPDTDITSAVTLIGLTTFGLSCIGVVIGHRFGSKYKSRAELAGGIILIGIGAKIFLEHMGYLS
jgi:manganese efflux pump family protein